jgi:hypothetical protein
MAFCRNHPQMAAAGRCAGCAEDYCASCMVTLHGQTYCGSCKYMALDGGTPSAVATAREAQERPLPAVNQAFSTGLVGYVFGTIGCFYVAGIICGVIAIQKGVRAKGELGQMPSRMARFKTTAAIVFGSLGILMNILNLAAVAMKVGR